MTPRLQVLVFTLATLLVLLGWDSTAHASAPFCDPQATTEDAPSPLLAVADLRLEQGDKLLRNACRSLPMLMQGSEPSPRDEPGATSPGLEPMMLTHGFDGFVEVQLRLLSAQTAEKPGPSGHSQEVFRPPCPELRTRRA